MQWITIIKNAAAQEKKFKIVNSVRIHRAPDHF